MKQKSGILRLLGLVALTIIYVALCYMMLRYKGFTLYNLLICAMSGAIIFVPIKKKFGSSQNTDQ